MKNKGFTLVEVLAVIVVIGLLMVLTIPNIMKMSRSTKEKAYLTKIDLIETSARQYASNQSVLRELKASSKCYKLTEDDKTGEVSAITEGTLGETDCYPGLVFTVEDLVQAHELNWDKENECVGCPNESYFNNVVINPRNNNIINKCYIYVYYKYNNPYAYFDRNTCDNAKNNISEVNGNEYNPVTK